MTQRIYKFRAWSGNMWLDGNDANIHAVNPDSIDIELKASYPHKELIICQWTGLLDKHGKEIYEGDILEFNYEPLGSFREEIIFDDGGFWIKRKDGSRFMPSEEHRKIIGNVYQGSHHKFHKFMQKETKIYQGEIMSVFPLDEIERTGKRLHKLLYSDEEKEKDPVYIQWRNSLEEAINDFIKAKIK